MAQRTYVGDQNQVSWRYESGTFASPSGANQWFGLVQTHTLDEEEGRITIRNVGGGDRNVDSHIDGPRTYAGELSIFPQNWKMLKFALGANSDNGSPSPFTHNISEVDTDNIDQDTGEQFPSFTVNDEHIFVTGSNFKRQINGCMVDSFTLESTEGEPLTSTVGYSAQSVTFSSGAAEVVTAETIRPHLWADSEWTVDGTALDTIKSWTVTLNNNLDVPNYSNGSRETDVPIPTNRDYEISITRNADSEDTKTFYESRFLGGSEFNMQLTSTVSTGSLQLTWTFSGCKLMDMESPTPNEGVNEQTFTIAPKTSSALVDDTLDQFYNSGSFTP